MADVVPCPWVAVHMHCARALLWRLRFWLYRKYFVLCPLRTSRMCRGHLLVWRGLWADSRAGVAVRGRGRGRNECLRMAPKQVTGDVAKY